MASSMLFLHFLIAGLLLLISVASESIEFRVGGPRGWTKPDGNVSGRYNHWARRNRFHIGDSVYFKYSSDSVLVVDREHYRNCNATSPLLEFTDGNTTFRFDRYGFFYFISGQLDHCESGQKLVIRVMVHMGNESTHLAPGPAPFSEPSGDGSSGSGTAGYIPSREPSSNGAYALEVAAARSSVFMAGTLSLVAFVVFMFV